MNDSERLEALGFTKNELSKISKNTSFQKAVLDNYKQLTGMGLQKSDFLKIAKVDGSALAISSLVKHAEALKTLGIRSASDLVKIASNIGAAQAINVLVDNAEALKTLGIRSAPDLVKIASNDGAAQAIKALGENAEALKTLGIRSASDLVKIASNKGAAQAIKALVENAEALKTLGIHSAPDLVKIASNDGASQAIKALVDNAEALKTLGIRSAADLVKIASNDGAAQAIKALVDNAEALKTLGIRSASDLVKIASNGGAAQAIKALVENAEALKTLGIHSAPDLVKIASNNGAAQAIKAIGENAETLKTLGIQSASDLVKIASHDGAAQALKALVDNAEALKTLGIHSASDLVKIASNTGAALTIKFLAQHHQELIDKSIPTKKIVELSSSGRSHKNREEKFKSLLAQSGSQAVASNKRQFSDDSIHDDEDEQSEIQSKKRAKKSSIKKSAVSLNVDDDNPPSNPEATLSSETVSSNPSDGFDNPNSMFRVVLPEETTPVPEVKLPKASKRKRTDELFADAQAEPKKSHIKLEKVDVLSNEEITKRLNAAIKVIRGSSSANNNCVHLAGAMLEYLSSGLFPSKPAPTRPATLKDFAADVMFDNVQIKSEPIDSSFSTYTTVASSARLHSGFFNRPIKPMLQTTPGAIYGEFDGELVQQYDLDNMPKINRESLNQTGVHMNDLNEALKRHAENRLDKKLCGTINFSLVDEEVEKPGHTIAFYVANGQVWFIEGQAIQHGVEEQPAVFHDLKSRYRFIDQPDNGVESRLFSSTVFYIPCTAVDLIKIPEEEVRYSLATYAV